MTTPASGSGTGRWSCRPEGELQRVVNAALSGFFQDIHWRIAAAIPPDVRSHMDNLLLVSESAVISGFENLKADPGRPGVDNFQGEIGKLRAIRAIGLRAEPFAEVPWKVLQMFKRRATNEKASEMREHPEGIPNQDFSFSRSNILQSPLSF